jgi:hypothetical protein
VIRASSVIRPAALAGWSWFECRHCFGLFIIGPSHQAGATRGEDRAAHRHEETCPARTDDDEYSGGDDEDDGSDYFRRLDQHDAQGRRS